MSDTFGIKWVERVKHYVRLVGKDCGAPYYYKGVLAPGTAHGFRQAVEHYDIQHTIVPPRGQPAVLLRPVYYRVYQGHVTARCKTLADAAVLAGYMGYYGVACFRREKTAGTDVVFTDWSQRVGRWRHLR
jgi:hypothetical protein